MRYIQTTKFIQWIKRALANPPRISILLILLTVLLLTSTALSASNAPSALEVQRYVIAGGGGHSEAGGLTLDGTVGQAVVGTTGQGTFDLCSGFWCGMGTYKLYIPLALQDS
jgi:hypothetical protein